MFRFVCVAVCLAAKLSRMFRLVCVAVCLAAKLSRVFRFVCVAVCLAAKLSRVFRLVCVALGLRDAAVTKELNSINGGSDDERKRRSDNRQRAGEVGTFYVNVEPEGNFSTQRL